MENRRQDPPITFCIILAGNFVDGNMVWTCMGIFYVVGMLPAVAIVVSIVAGVSFGILMAAYHWWRKKANQLPDWNSLE